MTVFGKRGAREHRIPKESLKNFSFRTKDEFQRNYTMEEVEGDTTSIRFKMKKDLTLYPAMFRYKACPRCVGTVYSPPYISQFHCLVCGWQQKCHRCFGDIGVFENGKSTYCKSCGSTR